jgi:hypothetical protein
MMLMSGSSPHSILLRFTSDSSTQEAITITSHSGAQPVTLQKLTLSGSKTIDDLFNTAERFTEGLSGCG